MWWTRASGALLLTRAHRPLTATLPLPLEPNPVQCTLCSVSSPRLVHFGCAGFGRKRCKCRMSVLDGCFVYTNLWWQPWTLYSWPSNPEAFTTLWFSPRFSCACSYCPCLCALFAYSVFTQCFVYVGMNCLCVRYQSGANFHCVHHFIFTSLSDSVSLTSCGYPAPNLVRSLPSLK